MRIRPIGCKIAVRPDRQPAETASGFLIPDMTDIPPMSGIVIAVGNGPASHARLVKTRATALRDAIEAVDDVAEQFRHPAALQVACENLARLLRSTPAAEHLVQVGDRVFFPMNAGHEVVLGENTDDAVLILDEDAVLGVCESAEVAA